MKTLVLSLALATHAFAQDPSAFEGEAALPAGPGLKVGPAAGYIKSKGADDASWFGGIAARTNLGEWLGAEASITFRQDEFLDGAATITQVPIQATALFYPPLAPEISARFYGLAGFGWYHTRIDYDDAIPLDGETGSATGIHVGLGVELPLGETATGYIDFRYVFIDEPGIDNSALEDEDWDTVMLALGAVIRF